MHTSYKLQSVKTGKIFRDTGWALDAVDEATPTLIRAVYKKKQLEVKDDSFGLYKYKDWLPINRMLEGSSPPITYKSKGLSKFLKLNNLWITFSGYFPEKLATMTTCSFKETEAYSVCSRIPSDNKMILVVASAGNTARAFAKICSDNHIPLLICVPEDNLNALWFENPINECVKLICSKKGSDYYDAINLSEIALSSPYFIPEGGAKNVARRDGMGTTVLSAVTTIGKIPEYYFQAVGSGTGAIAAWETNLRLINDGRFGRNRMRLMISQNIPFVPIYKAWKKKSPTILPLDDSLARKQVEEIKAKVLSNRKPPYAIPGGLYDALEDTNGEVLIANNDELEKAGKIFLETEGIDIHPAAAIATATLINSVEKNNIGKNSLVLLNITGGGEKRFKQEKSIHYLRPSYIFDFNPSIKEVAENINCLFVAYL